MKNVLLIALFSVTLFGCVKEPECNYDECYEVALAADVQNLEAYLQSNNITATKHCSGMYYIIDQQGNGNRPTACSNISLAYEGKLTNGTVFDATPAGQTTSFGLGRVITGFRNGLLQVRSGGKARLFIPPSLGYGNTANGTIPANSILIFTVELKGVE